MIPVSQIRKGTVIVHQDAPYVVVEYSHQKQGRAGAVVRCKIKNLQTGQVIEISYQGSDKVAPADLAHKRCQFLYADETGVFFMDESFEQISVGTDLAEDSLLYLKEGEQVDIAFWGEKAVYLKLPPKVDLKVVEAPPAVKGDTAQGATKTIKLETGIEVNAPLFIKEGEIVRINTETGEYVERA